MPAKPTSLSRFRSAYQRQIALWILRAFASGTARKLFFTNRGSGYRDEDIAAFLDMPHPQGKPEQPHCDEIVNALNCLATHARTVT